MKWQAGFVFPGEAWSGRGSGRFIGAGRSRGYRAHDPGLTDDEMDELWGLGADMAGGCAEFCRERPDAPETNCVYCERLAACRREHGVQPDLLRLLKAVFRHDLAHD